MILTVDKPAENVINRDQIIAAVSNNSDDFRVSILQLVCVGSCPANASLIRIAKIFLTIDVPLRTWNGIHVPTIE